jgi:hypothetical protein
VQGEKKQYSRIHGAWCVRLIAGDNHVAVGSQRLTQGEIDIFDLEFTSELCGAVLEVRNNGVVFAGNRRTTNGAVLSFGSSNATFAIAGMTTNPVQVFRTGRAVYLEFLRLWTGFELPSSWIALPDALWIKSESKYFRFYEVASN